MTEQNTQNIASATGFGWGRDRPPHLRGPRAGSAPNPAYLAPFYIRQVRKPAYFLSLKFNGSLSLSLSLRIFPLYKASFILAAKKFHKPIFKHMLRAKLGEENWLVFSRRRVLFFALV